jgi:hypothetical protein
MGYGNVALLFLRVIMPRLDLSYDASLYFKSDLDSEIEKVIGKNCCGSGMGFGERDMSFTFRSKADADAAKKKLTAFIKKKKLTKQVRIYA